MTKKRSNFILSVMVTALLVVTLLPYLFPYQWYIDIFSHFKPYYILVLTFLMIVAWWSRPKKWVAIAIVLGLAWNLYCVLPLYISNESGGEAEHSFKVGSVNILATNQNDDKVIRDIQDHDPDIVAIVEVTDSWRPKLVPLFEQYPYRHIFTRDDNFGLALFSKFPMEFRMADFGKKATPSIIGEMQIGNVPITVVAVHPEPPMNIPDMASRMEQFSNMREQRQEWSENTILLGDLNTSSFSLQFTDLTEKLRLRDSRKGFGILPTWPTNTWPLMTTLDHILIGGNLQVLDRMVGKHVGSDHLPVYAVLGL